MQADSIISKMEITEPKGITRFPVKSDNTIDEDEKGVCKVETLGGKQDMMVISESGLYTLIMYGWLREKLIKNI